LRIVSSSTPLENAYRNDSQESIKALVRLW
jgi:hypothetical protein